MGSPLPFGAIVYLFTGLGLGLALFAKAAAHGKGPGPPFWQLALFLLVSALCWPAYLLALVVVWSL